MTLTEKIRALTELINLGGQVRNIDIFACTVGILIMLALVAVFSALLTGCAHMELQGCAQVYERVAQYADYNRESLSFERRPIPAALREAQECCDNAH